MATATYTCESCGDIAERDFRVTHFRQACESGCGFVRFIRKSLFEKLQDVPDETKPDEWDSLDKSQRLAVALQSGILSQADVWEPDS